MGHFEEGVRNQTYLCAFSPSLIEIKQNNHSRRDEILESLLLKIGITLEYPTHPTVLGLELRLRLGLGL